MVEQGTENPRVVGSIPTGGTTADLAHLVERDLAKVEVAGSSPVIRSRIADANRIHSHPLFSDLFPSLFRFFPSPLIFHLMAPEPSGKAEVCKTFIPGPIPGGASKCSGLKRCRSKNPRFSRVFFVFLRFPRFFKIRLKTKTKRCQIPISTFLPESDWRTTISGRFSESFFSPKTALFSFSSKK